MRQNIENKSFRPIYTAVGIAIMLAIGTLIYSNTFDSPFLFDDEFFILKDKAIRMADLSWDSIKTAAFEGSPRHRYLPNISWALNYYFGKLNPFGYHLVNLIIHLLTGIFLFFFTKNTLRVYPNDSQNIHPEILAFFAALIWIVQPVGTQSVTYICQRMASMVALFYILSLLLYVQARLAMRKNPGERLVPGLFFLGCALSALCAIATKENAGTLPIVILLYEWFFFQELKLNWSRRQILWICFFGIAFTGVVFWYLGENPVSRIIASYSYNNRNFNLPQRIMTEWRIMVYYISLFLWAPPGRLNLDHDYPLSLSPIDPPTTMLALAAIIGLFALAAYSAKKNRLIAFCILWFFITQATESTIIGIELIFEHRTYIPFMMTSLFFVMIISRLIRNRSMAYTLLVAAALIFSVWTYQRNQIWQDPVTFWTDCAAKSPDKYRPQYDLAVALYNAGDLSGAVIQSKKAIQINPDDAKAHTNMGNAFLKQDNIDEALQCFHRALALNPNYADAHNNLGNALLKQGNTDDALQSFRRALALDPDLADAHNNIGNVFFKQGKTGEALQYFQRALSLNPDQAEAHNNLANALMQKGDIRGAIDHFQAILKKYPDHVEANINLGAALARTGQIDEALIHYQTALDTDPNNPEAHNNMGVLLVQKNMLPEALEHFKHAIVLRPGYESAINNMQRLKQMQK
jgi:tetratricopeptide (TPR) repeat protein